MNKKTVSICVDTTKVKQERFLKDIIDSFTLKYDKEEILDIDYFNFIIEDKEVLESFNFFFTEDINNCLENIKDTYTIFVRDESIKLNYQIITDYINSDLEIFDVTLFAKMLYTNYSSFSESITIPYLSSVLYNTKYIKNTKKIFIDSVLNDYEFILDTILNTTSVNYESYYIANKSYYVLKKRSSILRNEITDTDQIIDLDDIYLNVLLFYLSNQFKLIESNTLVLEKEFYDYYFSTLLCIKDFRFVKIYEMVRKKILSLTYKNFIMTYRHKQIYNLLKYEPFEKVVSFFNYYIYKPFELNISNNSVFIDQENENIVLDVNDSNITDSISINLAISHKIIGNNLLLFGNAYIPGVSTYNNEDTSKFLLLKKGNHVLNKINLISKENKSCVDSKNLYHYYFSDFEGIVNPIENSFKGAVDIYINIIDRGIEKEAYIFSIDNDFCISSSKKLLENKLSATSGTPFFANILCINRNYKNMTLEIRVEKPSNNINKYYFENIFFVNKSSKQIYKFVKSENIKTSQNNREILYIINDNKLSNGIYDIFVEYRNINNTKTNLRCKMYSELQFKDLSININEINILKDDQNNISFLKGIIPHTHTKNKGKGKGKKILNNKSKKYNPNSNIERLKRRVKESKLWYFETQIMFVYNNIKKLIKR